MSRRSVVIPAGGDGIRPRAMPHSIAGGERPEQFCAVVTEDALLPETRRRAAPVAPAHRTLVVVNRAHDRVHAALLAGMRAPAPDWHRSFGGVTATPGTVGEASALERLDCGLPAVDLSRHVLGVRPDRLAVLPVRGVDWDDLSDPDRVVATRRPIRSEPVPPIIPVAIPA